MGNFLSTGRNLAYIRPQHLQQVMSSNVRNKQVALLTRRSRSSALTDTAPAPDYQYFKKSEIPTFHFQDSLPRLPIPELTNTCQRYLRAQQPLLSPEAFNRTKGYVDKFLSGEGVKCQTALVEQDKKNRHTSYITELWFDTYLADRNPLPINVNPCLVFENHPVPQLDTQLVKAANLVISSLRFYKSLHKEILEPEIYFMNPKNKNNLFKTVIKALPKSLSWYGAYAFKAFPLDMSQYKYLFNTTRIPVYNGKDEIKHVHGKRHVLIMKGGNFHVLDVLNEDGSIASADVILGGIEKVLHSNSSSASFPVGILTTENRDVWASARKHLESLGNSEALELIDTALFNLVLDDISPGNDFESMVQLFLHGGGSNRWFDKSFSLIVARDGTAAVNFEHSWGDGVAVLRYFNDIHTDSIRTPRVLPTTSAEANPPLRKLEFKLDEAAKAMISEATKKFDTTRNALKVNIMEYQGCGRHACRSFRISPDALMQLAFQNAHYLLNGNFVATYESCSTAAFKHGRTEAVRPCTIETQKFCKALKQSKQLSPSNKKELRNMIYQCSEVHTKLIKEAAMGQGFDRHLFALRVKAEQLGLKPDMFSDPAYSAINHNVLSTSTLVSNNLKLGAFGPVVPNGFGIGYSLWSDRLGSVITSYEHITDGTSFTQALHESLNHLSNVLKP